MPIQQSTLASLTPMIWEIKDLETARNFLLDHLMNTNVKDRDKMIVDIKEIKSLPSLHRYTANALLKYEGLGVSKI